MLQRVHSVQTNTCVGYKTNKQTNKQKHLSLAAQFRSVTTLWGGRGGSGGEEGRGGRGHRAPTSCRTSLESEPLSVSLCRPVEKKKKQKKKTVQEEEERGSASLCLSSTGPPPLRLLAHAAGSQGKFSVCFFFHLFVFLCRVCLCLFACLFSCFQKATEGRRCYCWEGPGGPGRTAARLGWPAREEAAGRGGRGRWVGGQEESVSDWMVFIVSSKGKGGQSFGLAGPDQKANACHKVFIVGVFLFLFYNRRTAVWRGDAHVLTKQVKAWTSHLQKAVRLL